MIKVDNIPLSLYWKDGSLWLLDQTKLPLEVVYEEQITVGQVWESIYQLKVRGAPAIGVAAAYGVLVSLQEHIDYPIDSFRKEVLDRCEYLVTARPTAVNLSWALKKMAGVAAAVVSDSRQLYNLLLMQAIQIHEDDKNISQKIGEYGAALLNDGATVHTHCNAGALAASVLGTALAPIYIASLQGKNIKVYADETRPLLQGSRLTSWELTQAGVDVTLITDSMAAFVYSKKLVDIAIVGCDRVAANGDTANKIGTLGVAIIAKTYNIPFYVACPSSTIDFDIRDGSHIVIEERKADEVRKVGGVYTAPADVKVYNPAFDVTPHSLITGFITEKGIVYPPFDNGLANLFK